MAHTYSHLYGLPATGLRFFTVYGPWGRPDMAAYLFTDAILGGRPIKVFNHGKMARDFTYIDTNVMGTLVMLEAARRIDRLTAFTYASSSSVYGANRWQPFSVEDRVDQPVSLYAATKRSC